MIKLGVLALFVVRRAAGLGLRQPVELRARSASTASPSAAGIIFFSYIGLDAVSTAGEEVKNPRRNMPLAIIFALVIVTAIYVAVTVVAVAAQPVAAFDGQEAGLSAILEHVTGLHLAGDGAGRGRGGLDLQRHAGRDLRPDADPVRDGPRRDDPAVLPQAEPAHADAGAGRRSSSRS